VPTPLYPIRRRHRGGPLSETKKKKRKKENEGNEK